MKYISHKKGFTLIELLVVVAIIGILSSIVLASLNRAREKGADAAIQADLNGIRSTAEIEFDKLKSSYNDTGLAITGDCTLTTDQTIFENATIQAALAHAKTMNGGQDGLCNVSDDGKAYAIAFPLKTAGTYWCVDNSSVARGQTEEAVPQAYTGLTGPIPAAIAIGGTSCQ
ncbi:prepilin-type N-terminal cleavage/methylation domain-containing protein [Candidatus Parcubacteria bacterium]|nr:prepilin-type N-terminal cleavage/methylation domain-containing protein [Candidatus Parcubacteria bacterium]